MLTTLLHALTFLLPVLSNHRFAHQPIQQNSIMHGLGHMGVQGVHLGLRPNPMLAEQQQQQQQQQAAQQQQQQQYLRQQALRVCHLMIVILSLAVLWLRIFILGSKLQSRKEAVSVHGLSVNLL